MKEELIEIATKKGFSSNVIGKSVGSIYSTKDFYYLWMCELQKWLRKVHDNEVFAKSEYKNLKKIGFYYGGNKVQYSTPTFKTYEEALEKGLQATLKLIK